MQAEKAVIDQAMRDAVHEAVMGQKRLGLLMVEGIDGQIVLTAADQFDEADTRPAQ